MILGIDPGVSGAVALVDPTGALVDVGDLTGVAGVTDAALLRALVLDLCCDLPATVTVAVVEAVDGRAPNAATARKLGESAGVCVGVCVGLGIRVERVRPAVWKRAHRLRADKAAARAAAANRWPGHAASFARGRDDGRAEAALIAAWWIERGSE